MANEIGRGRLPGALKALGSLSNGVGVLSNDGAGNVSWAAAAPTVDTYGDVGSYCLAGRASGAGGSHVAANATIAGSSLTPAGSSAVNNHAFSGSTLSGTWRAMGYYPRGDNAGNTAAFTLWTRTV